MTHDTSHGDPDRRKNKTNFGITNRHELSRQRKRAWEAEKEGEKLRTGTSCLPHRCPLSANHQRSQVRGERQDYTLVGSH